MDKKTILITGSTDGIGYQSAIELAKAGHHVIVHGRNRERVESAVRVIAKESNRDNLSYVIADLLDFNQIKKMASEIHDKFDKLDILINNAGVYRSKLIYNQNGLEETFVVNYLAPVLLSNLLLDLLKKAESGRIVNVASQVHSNHIDFDDLQLEKGYTGVKAYANSKLALILFTFYFAERLRDTHITINALHPGVINTKLLRSAFGVGGASLTEGANALIFVAIAPEIKKVSGKYFVNNRPESSKNITYDKEIQKRLWEKTEEILKPFL
jgi:NAD(P)-dependent dehydrogenase (short-subunit alcohol dehydrogenase family)